MIIFNEQKNQLCNRIFSLLPSIAYSIENDEKMVVMFFSEKYLNLFPNLKTAKNIRFILSCNDVFPKGLLKVLYHLVKVISGIATLNRKKFSFLTIPDRKNRILFVRGWKERFAPSYITKHYLTIRKLFEPPVEVREKVGKYLDKENTIIVGVHIRRKDYRAFRGGAYFYDNDVYLSFMKQIYDLLLPLGKKVEFLICSDEPFPVEQASGYFIIQLPSSDAITDLYALSLCNYIIGPPSTFSQWASFSGQVPLRVIKDKDEKLSLSDFAYVETMDSFNNK